MPKDRNKILNENISRAIGLGIREDVTLLNISVINKLFTHVINLDHLSLSSRTTIWCQQMLFTKRCQVLE